jgi:hypothetical protein
MKDSAIHVTGKEPEVAAIVRATFPEYAGRKVCIQILDGPIDVRSYWSEGSRSYFRFLHLDTGTVSAEVPAQSAFDPPIRNAGSVTVPDGVACVEHSIFCGTDSGITIHIPASNAPKYLPPTLELSRWERIVLAATRSLKSSYNGIPDYRLHEAQQETGITRDAWQMAKDALIVKGLLNKAGAITVTGKNAIGWTSLSELKREVTP